MYKIIDGKKVASELRSQLKEQIKPLETKPGLAVIIVGEDPASKIYVGFKHKACLEVGMNSFQHKFPENTKEEELIELIHKLNKDNTVHGILVQMPLPKHINKDNIIIEIDPKKDVDGFHPINTGKLFHGLPALRPCTPSGVIKLLEHYNIKIEGKNIVVIGRSFLVGQPLSIMLLNKNATVTICHSKTKNISHHTLNAEILISAVGRKDLIKANIVKKDAVIIDVGINKVDGKICGDVDFKNVKEKASFITPVPGGVGPMTIACLLENTLKAYGDLNEK